MPTTRMDLDRNVAELAAMADALGMVDAVDSLHEAGTPSLIGAAAREMRVAAQGANQVLTTLLGAGVVSTNIGQVLTVKNDLTAIVGRALVVEAMAIDVMCGEIDKIASGGAA